MTTIQLRVPAAPLIGTALICVLAGCQLLFPFDRDKIADERTSGPASAAGSAGSGGSLVDGSASSAGNGGSLVDGSAASSSAEKIAGLWLFCAQWSGSHRCSWVRFSRADPWKKGSVGEASLLSGDGLTDNEPYWSCQGIAAYSVWDMTTIQILASGCSFPGGNSVFIFDSFQAPGASDVHGAILEAAMHSEPGGGPMKGYKFDVSQCDDAMSTCADPFVHDAGTGAQVPDTGVALAPSCSTAGGVLCTAARWDLCPVGFEMVAAGTGHWGCGDDGWCCQAAPVSTCSMSGTATCVPGACTDCFAPSPDPGLACETGRTCCVDMCD